MSIRIGFGTDIHRLEQGRDLWLGGVKINSPKGAVGHSDADVLLHALIDALLGATSNRDIGTHFPDTDPLYKGISSLKLLEKTIDLIGKQWEIINIDSVIHLETPKISPFFTLIQNQLSKILAIDSQRINIKAKTSEGLGVIGKGDAIKAEVIILLQKTEVGN